MGRAWLALCASVLVGGALPSPGKANPPAVPLSAHPRCGEGERWNLAIRFLRFTGAHATVHVRGACLPGQRTTVTGDVETTWIIRAFWRVRDRIQTELETNATRTVLTRVWQDENGSSQYREEVYSPEAVVTRTQLPGRAPTTLRTSILPGTLDPFTVLMVLRGEPLADGQVYTVPIFSDGKVYQGTVRVLGRQACEVLGHPTRCILLRATFMLNGKPSSVFSEIWLSDDTRRVPVMVDAVTSYGRLSSVLTGVEKAP